MDKQLELDKLVHEDLERCNALHSRLSALLPHMPAGSLVIRCGTYYRALRENGKQYFAMLTSEEDDLLQNLKLKRYISKALPVLKQRIEANTAFLHKAAIYDPQLIINNLPAQYHDAKDLDIYLVGDIDPVEWRTSHYKQNPMEITIPHYTSGGLKTRSKSEELIANKLEEHGFHFRYEPELLLGSKRVYPDFAILLPNRRRIVYWEHLGMMDDPEYALRNLDKLDLYTRHGISLGVNMIITYETKDHPLTIVDVNNKIRDLNIMDRI